MKINYGFEKRKRELEKKKKKEEKKRAKLERPSDSKENGEANALLPE
ncbi:MAG: hypothetical protein WCH57_07385 [Verrucomicrobiota bacterium]